MGQFIQQTADVPINQSNNALNLAGGISGTGGDNAQQNEDGTYNADL